MIKIITHSEKETKDFAKKLAKKIKAGVLALTGELGAGKTTFVQGFAEGLGIKEKIISPTFVLIRQHQIPKATPSSPTFYHIDLYRLDVLKAIKHLGIEEIMENPDNLVLIEWAEKIKSMLPKNAVHISFKTINRTHRRISIESL